MLGEMEGRCVIARVIMGRIVFLGAHFDDIGVLGGHVS